MADIITTVEQSLISPPIDFLTSYELTAGSSSGRLIFAGNVIYGLVFEVLSVPASYGYRIGGENIYEVSLISWSLEYFDRVFAMGDQHVFLSQVWPLPGAPITGHAHIVLKCQLAPGVNARIYRLAL